jgi:hypothetical protein
VPADPLSKFNRRDTFEIAKVSATYRTVGL